ncbi:GlsB/YeaQ/YmgE family stress response membrane protein [Dysgonomonas sp. Marseille-P4677]|uniref:GlsB/YeaQ/YmgE family stress response membrane protein n=1 Tax=Dysgonomonas sp. Marseille-P4677 TaxID=2364790 RepID=UPI0019119795|nr:GlsB/YeaQ/YmgE family stress response membrane protein [Dysgonomonas sp. Marseille-P4677]MBK5722253.1 GlsB/YeaQ/YmgE family stress response membrane protein [Dysgonomonas sp. Marseille-P4677]
MEGFGIIWSVIIGILIGAIATWLVKGKGLSIVISLIVGLLGSFLGRRIYCLLGFDIDTILEVLLISTIGAIVLLWMLFLLMRTRNRD